MTKRARLGLTVPTIPAQAPIAKTALSLARDLCAKGYEEIWLAEVNAAEGYALAGALSQAVPGIRIGTGVVPLQTRTVMIHAMGALTLHELTEGNFALGIGISSENIVRDWAGQPFDQPLVRMREALTSLRKLLAGEKVTLEGQTLRMKNLKLAATANVPLYVGALNAQMLRLAGALADGVMLNMVPESALPQVLAEVHAGAREAGRDPAQIEIVTRLHIHIADTLDEGRELVRRTFGPYVATAGYNRFFRWAGMEEAARVAECFAKGDRAGVAAAMSDRICDAVGVTGPEAHVRDRIRAYAEQGVNVCVLNPIAPDPVAQRRALDVLANVLRD